MKEHVENLKIGEKIIGYYLVIMQNYATCRKGQVSPQNTSENTAAFEAMIDAVNQ